MVFIAWRNKSGADNVLGSGLGLYYIGGRLCMWEPSLAGHTLHLRPARLVGAGVRAGSDMLTCKR